MYIVFAVILSDYCSRCDSVVLSVDLLGNLGLISAETYISYR